MIKLLCLSRLRLSRLRPEAAGKSCGWVRFLAVACAAMLLPAASAWGAVPVAAPLAPAVPVAPGAPGALFPPPPMVATPGATAEKPPVPPVVGAVPGESPVPPPPAKKAPQGPILMNFKNASLRAVLDYLSEAAGLVIVEVATVEGSVTVTSRQPLTVDEAVELLNTILKEKGYAAVRTGKTLKIVALADAKKAAIPVTSGGIPEKIELSDQVVTHIIPVLFADAAQLKANLTTLLPTYADLQANTATNVLILTATQTDVRRIVEIVHSLDSQMANISEVKVFPLQYANAANAARLITDLFRADASGGGRGGAAGGVASFLFGGGPGGGPGGPGGGRGGGGGGLFGGSDSGATAGGGARQQKVTASSDDRTNNLVVSAPSDLMVVIEDVVKKLDANPAADQAVFPYRLKNANAVNLESVLNNLFGTSSGSTGRATTTGSSTTRTGFGSAGTSTGTGGRTSGTGGRTSGGSSSSSSMRGLGTTSFGSTATGGRTGTTGTTGGRTGGVGGMGRLSGAANQAASDLAGQVFVVADADTNSLLVTTSTKNFDRVKAILDELDRPVPQVLVKVLIAEVTHENTEDLGFEISALNLTGSAGPGFKAGTSFSVAAQTQGLVFRLVQDNVTAALHAIAGVGKLDVLSRPYILTSDNQQASIMVGQSVPLITSSLLTSTGETINSISYNDLGIILTVTPHINPDGLVIMDVYQEISAFTGQSVQISETVNAPVYAKRVAQSKVAIRGDQTIVIGGLMEDRNTDHIDKVPVLGDIPGLGRLFQRTTKDKTKTELLIFLTPHVAQVPEALKDMAEAEKAGAKVIKEAVEPGAFEEHIRGLERGAAPPPAAKPPAAKPPVPVLPPAAVPGDDKSGKAPPVKPAAAEPVAEDPAADEESNDEDDQDDQVDKPAPRGAGRR
jgi:general secretion pathway protein D